LTVPALTTRRVNTSVEMRFGETFMLGGLIEVQDTAQTSKVPWLVELPYLGALFRTVSYQSTETELVILVTPVLAGAMTDCQVPPGGPGMFTDQPTDRELYSYGLIEVPSYGGHCANCGNGSGGYPPPVIDFDLSHGSPGPLLTPVPVQEIPPGAPQGTSTAPTMPALPASAVSPHGPPAEIVAPPAASWTSPSNDSSTSYSRSQSIRQVSAQSPTGGPNPVSQAGYTTPPPVWPGSTGSSPQAANPAVQPTSTSPSTRGTGLYEPQSGLYVPAVPAGP